MKARSAHLFYTLAVAAFIPVAALAANVDTGTTTIGTHSTYGSWFSAFWRNGLDYTVMTSGDGRSTYINVPSSNGNIIFRAANSGPGSNYTSDPNLRSLMYLTAGGDLYVSRSINGYVPNAGTAVSGTSLSGTGVLGSGETAGVFGASTNGSGVSGQSSAGWAGLFHGLGPYGVYGRGTTYGVYSQGPLYVNSASTIKVGGSSTWTVSSDKRVKQDVTDFQAGLAEVERVHPVKFKYNGLGGTRDAGKTEYVGIIAQELEEIAPYMVSSVKKKLRDSDKEPTEVKQTDANAFTYMLINAVKELAQQNRELNAQNKELQRLVCKSNPDDAFCLEKFASAK